VAVEPTPDASLDAASATIGAAFVPLVFGPGAWTHRRVETIDVLSLDVVRRQTSVDFTVPAELREQLAIPGTDQYAVPLATLRKRPLRHFDLRDEERRAVPVLGRDQDARLAWAALLSAATNVEGIGALSPDTTRRLELITNAPLEAALAERDRLDEDARSDEELAQLLSDDRVRLLLGELAENYLLVAAVSQIDRRRVLKFAYDSFYSPAPTTWRRWLGWEPRVIELDVPSAARASSFHAEVVVPEELRAVAGFVVDSRTGKVLGADGEADRVAIHAPDVPAAAAPRLVMGVAAERAGFPSAALGVALVVTALLLFGALVGDLRVDVAGPPVSVLLAGSAIFAGAVSRAGEHRVVRATYLGPRLAMVAVALAALAAAAALAFDLGRDEVRWTWAAGGTVSGLATIALARFWKVSRPLVRSRN
jgi:hypothetical protein